MFFTQFLPVEIWFIIYKIEHTLLLKPILEEIKELRKEITEMNSDIRKSNKWSLIEWNNFKIEFNKKDFVGRCQTESLKYFEKVPNNHSCVLCNE